MMFFSGGLMLQIGGCVPIADLIDIAQTVFLAITAAGSLAIIDNI